MRSRFRNGFFAAAAVSVWLSAGCSGSDSPLAPQAPRQVKAATSTTSSGAPDANAIDQLARFRQHPQITIAWAKAWIGPEGGRVDFYGFTIIVPPGAVDKVTMFTIKLPVDPNGSDHVLAEFGPHGQAFNQPITIGFPYRGTTIEGDPHGTVVWWNDGWVPMGGTVSADSSQIFTTTPHFSDYGTTSRTGGMTISGG